LVGLTVFNGGSGLLDITPLRSCLVDFESISGSFLCNEHGLPVIVGREVDLGRTAEDEDISTFSFCRVIKLIAGSAVLFSFGLKDDSAEFFDSSTSSQGAPVWSHLKALVAFRGSEMPAGYAFGFIIQNG